MTSPHLTKIREKMEPTLKMLWASWEASSILSPSNRFWTKDKYEFQTLAKASLRVRENEKRKCLVSLWRESPPRKHLLQRPESVLENTKSGWNVHKNIHLMHRSISFYSQCRRSSSGRRGVGTKVEVLVFTIGRIPPTSAFWMLVVTM